MIGKIIGGIISVVVGGLLLLALLDFLMSQNAKVCSTDAVRQVVNSTISESPTQNPVG